MNQASDLPKLEKISKKFERLQTAIAGGRTPTYILRVWSEFIRERDGHRCVDCHSRTRLSAHHICRKSFIAGAQFDTGNGITLCSSCHAEMHRGFNARPDLTMPVDAQGGEKLALMERLFSILTDDAVERNLTCDKFYYLSDQLLNSFKRMQGFDPATHFPGARVEQAYLILAECELGIRRAMAEESGVPFVGEPLLPGGYYLGLAGQHGRPGRSVVIRTYVPRTKPTQ